MKRVLLALSFMGVLSASAQDISNSQNALLKSGGTMSGAIAMGGNSITGMATQACTGACTFQSNGSTVAGVITTAQRWGFGSAVGAQTPTNTTVAISNNTTVVDAATPGLSPVLHVVGADNTNGIIVVDGFGSSLPGVAFRRAIGSAAAPTVVSLSTVLGSFYGLGYDGSAGKYGFSGEIDFFASETWSASAHGGGIKFWSNPNGSTTQSQSMTLQQSGGLSIGAAVADPGIGSLLVNKTYGAVPTVFASLVTCNSASKGFRAFITDELAVVAFNTAATGGGANNVPVFCDGTVWRIG